MTRRALFAVLAGIPAGAAIAAAQEKVVPAPVMPPRDTVVSGDAIGFRIDEGGRNGAVKGRFVVKVDGGWREIELTPRIRIAR